MFKIEENYLKLQKNYLFAEIANRVKAFKSEHPDKKVISLGIGDVTRPLAPAVIEALHKAVDEMADEKTFHGYAPDGGYDFLRNAISKNDYKDRGIDIEPDEIFVSDGAKSDTANIGDILDRSNSVAICDPVYPVYLDTNIMAGRSGDFADEKWDNLAFMPCLEEKNFTPEIPDKAYDMIYLCYPNNPTGLVATYDELKAWVDYARKNHSLILFDSAYEAFIRGDYPHSIYEIEGAKECAIEFRSFSKTAGFTGLRCAYTVVPKALMCGEYSLHDFWARRTGTKFNGVAYIVQRAAEAVYSDEGKKQIKATIDYYLENARIIKDALKKQGFTVYGGENAPYIWLKTPDGMSSWDFFDKLLNEANLVGTPGSGFGKSGEGFFRLTAFGSREDTLEAIERIAKLKM